MKKILTAGAVSLVLAAMPLVGTFALPAESETQAVDTIEVTVEPSCYLSRTEGSGYYSAELMPESDEILGWSSFEAYCNTGGFYINYEFTDLDAGGDSIEYSSYNYGSGSGTWVAYDYYNENYYDKMGQFIFTEDPGSYYFTVGYRANTRYNQTAGTYTGYATYTLSEAH